MIVKFNEVKDSILKKSMNNVKEKVEKGLEQNGVVTAKEINDILNEELGIEQPGLRTNKFGFTESPFKEKEEQNNEREKV